MYQITLAKVLEIKRLYRDGLTVRRVASAAGVAKNTALAYRPDGLVCPCGQAAGHKGWCGVRIGFSESRQSYLERCAAQSQYRQGVVLARVRERKEENAWWWLIRQLERPVASFRRRRAERAKIAPLSSCYPYIREGEETELLLLVNNLVPKTMPDAVRADVCQELLLSVLMGEVSRESIEDHVGEYSRRVYREMGNKWRDIPIDAPIERGGQTYRLIDVLAAPEQDSEYAMKHLYVRGGMPYGGALADCNSASDMADRISGAWEANRLLTPERKTFGTSISESKREDHTSVTMTTQVAGLGRRKMSSKIRHAGHGKMRAYEKSRAVADAKKFAVQDYLALRLDQEMEGDSTNCL